MAGLVLNLTFFAQWYLVIIEYLLLKAATSHILFPLYETIGFAGIYSDIFKANKTKECKEPLEVLYNKMNCAIHRNGIVEILIENKVISDKIRQEIKFDCDLDTRKLAEWKEKQHTTARVSLGAQHQQWNSCCWLTLFV